MILTPVEEKILGHMQPYSEESNILERFEKDIDDLLNSKKYGNKLYSFYKMYQIIYANRKVLINYISFPKLIVNAEKMKKRLPNMELFKKVFAYEIYNDIDKKKYAKFIEDNKELFNFN